MKQKSRPLVAGFLFLILGSSTGFRELGVGGGDFDPRWR